MERASLDNARATYLSKLKDQFDGIYFVARSARSKGFDPALEPESIVTVDVAERVEKAVGPAGVAHRIRELSLEIPREEVALKVAEEVSLGEFGSAGQEAPEQAIRTALAILDEGVTAAPIQGVSAVRVKTNPDRTRYLALYFAGPIRSAGGTEMGLILVVADYVRRLLGLDRYKATEVEARRFVEELRLYEREVARFQYKVTDEELFNAIMKLPIEVNGVETDPVEVASFRNLPRIETNRVRGGALRVVNDGLIGRSQKVLRIVEKLGIEGWAWLADLRPPLADAEEAREFMFMEDVVGGRPIFCFPGVPGGFRLRYGRSRNTGLAALGVHPATMHVLKNFVATGTQLRIERPGKAGVVTPVETIEPPVVRLKDRSVVRVEDEESARKLGGSIDKILFLGDLLVTFGEFLENNRPLLPSGFTEEWWAENLRTVAHLNFDDLDAVASKGGVPKERLQRLLSNPLGDSPTAVEALSLSQGLGIPLHPKYTYFWEHLTLEELKHLRRALSAGVDLDSRRELARITARDEPELKGILEKLCVPHRVQDDSIIIEDGALVLARCLALSDRASELKGEDALQAIANLSGVAVRRKAPIFIGARMGRPEKAKRREMTPLVHCLFPLGLAGGSRRNIAEAARDKTLISVELVKRRCRSCRAVTHANLCMKCGERTKEEFTCSKCGRQVPDIVCPICKVHALPYERRSINIREMFDLACKRLGLAPPPDVVKGVRGLTSETRTPEPIEKGILRAKHDLSVFKDGTIRFDATNAPLTHFIPAEVGLSVEKARELGYDSDKDGKPLDDPSEMCTLQIQDVIIPERCSDYFLRVAEFSDELLESLYGLPPHYNANAENDLIGHLVIGLSPHTSVGVVGRIIGFTKANVCFAHPFWHAAKRRDCDGDEDAVTLALDVLLNFSRAFLPSKIGGMMDAPLLLTLMVKPDEVARQAFNMETVERFPLRFFEEAGRGSDPKLVSDFVELVAHRVSDEHLLESIGYTHFIHDINTGNLESAYKKLGSMLDKVTEQLSLAESIRAVQASDVARRVLSTHFMRDLTGNLKAFSTQRMRCMNCNSKFRRIPLKGVCPRCGGRISLTVYRGTIEKYLNVARDLVKRYDLGKYHEQRLTMLQQEIDSLFREVEERKKQPVLGDFM